MDEIISEENPPDFFSLPQKQISFEDKHLLNTIGNYHWFVSFYVKNIHILGVKRAYREWCYDLGATENLKISVAFLEMCKHDNYIHLLISGVNEVDKFTLHDINRSDWSSSWGFWDSSFLPISLVYKNFIKKDDFINDKNHTYEVHKINRALQQINFSIVH